MSKFWKGFVFGAEKRQRDRRDAVKPAIAFGMYVLRYKVGGYSMPFVCPNDDVASSSIRTLVDNSKEDLLVGVELLRIADYDTSTATVKPYRARFFVNF